MTITQFNLLSFKPVIPLFSIYYSYLNIRPPKLVTKRLSDTTTYIYISVAKPYGRFGQKLESLQGRSGQGTGQGNTVQDRSWQRDRSKAAEQK